MLYKAKGDYAGAEPLLRRATEIMKRALRESDPDYVGSLNDLANLYRDMGDFARAEPLYRQALAIAAKMKSMKTGAHPATSSACEAWPRSTEPRATTPVPWRSSIRRWETR